MIAINRFIVVYALLIAAALYLALHQDISVAMKTPFDQFPRTLREWRMTGEFTLTAEVQKVLKATDVLSRQYVSPEGKKVNLYIGYHAGGKDSGGIHSPKHCLPGSGWFENSTKRTQLDVAGQKINLVQAIYQKGESKELFIYWFQVRGKTISEEYSLKVAEISNSILYRRRDSSFIRISVPFEGDEQVATVIGERFVRDFFPDIQLFLPV
jgi:EpsI family protein